MLMLIRHTMSELREASSISNVTKTEIPKCWSWAHRKN